MIRSCEVEHSSTKLQTLLPRFGYEIQPREPLESDSASCAQIEKAGPEDISCIASSVKRKHAVARPQLWGDRGSHKLHCRLAICRYASRSLINLFSTFEKTKVSPDSTKLITFRKTTKATWAIYGLFSY